jgi:amphiphysin
MAGEFDVIGKHPESQDTVRNLADYQNVMDELRSALAPELELIESRIAGPSRELQTIIKQIRKAITKRDHKVRPFSTTIFPNFI